MAGITYIDERFIDINNLPDDLPYNKYMVIAECGEVDWTGHNSFTNCCEEPYYDGKDYVAAKAVFDELAANNDGVKFATILIGQHKDYPEWEVIVSNEIA